MDKKFSLLSNLDCANISISEADIDAITEDKLQSDTLAAWLAVVNIYNIAHDDTLSASEKITEIRHIMKDYKNDANA